MRIHLSFYCPNNPERGAGASGGRHYFVARPGAQGEEQSVRRGSVGELRIERVTIERLKLDPRNPRLHSDGQIKQIAGSIKAFGFNVPVLADQGGNLLAGPTGGVE
jgi:hypothetical protein